MYPDWVYRLFTGEAVDRLGIFGMEMFNGYITEAICRTFSGLGALILIIWTIICVSWGMLTGTLSHPTYSGIECEKGALWFIQNNRQVILKNTSDHDIEISRVEVIIQDCSTENACDYVKDVYQPIEPVELIKSGQSYIFDMSSVIDNDYAKSYQFRGYEKDSFNYDSHIPAWRK